MFTLDDNIKKRGFLLIVIDKNTHVIDNYYSYIFPQVKEVDLKDITGNIQLPPVKETLKIEFSDSVSTKSEKILYGIYFDDLNLFSKTSFDFNLPYFPTATSEKKNIRTISWDTVSGSEELKKSIKLFITKLEKEFQIYYAEIYLKENRNNENKVKELLRILTIHSNYLGDYPQFLDTLRATDFYKKSNILAPSDWEKIEIIEPLHVFISACSGDKKLFDTITFLYKFQETPSEELIIDSLKDSSGNIQLRNKLFQILATDWNEVIPNTIYKLVDTYRPNIKNWNDNVGYFNLITAKNKLYQASVFDNLSDSCKDPIKKMCLCNESMYQYETGIQDYIWTELELLKQVPNLQDPTYKIRIGNLQNKILKGFMKDIPFINNFRKANNILRDLSLRLCPIITENKYLEIEVNNPYSLKELRKYNIYPVQSGEKRPPSEIIENFSNSHVEMGYSFILPKTYFHATLKFPEELSVYPNLITEFTHEYMEELGYEKIRFFTFKSCNSESIIVDILAPNHLYYKNQYHPIGTAMCLERSKEIIGKLEEKFDIAELLSNSQSSIIKENLDKHLKQESDEDNSEFKHKRKKL